MKLTSKLLAAALVLAAACSKNAAAPPPPPPAVVCTDATPCALVPGADATAGMITAVAQVDLYTVEVPASRAGVRTILQLKLDDIAPATPVKLTAILLPATGTSALATLGPTKTSGPQALRGNVLMPGPGTYRVLVRDVLATAVDSHNGYTISAALLDDPDAAFEPDDALAGARPIAFTTTTAQQTGSIAFAGDVDLLTFSVAAPGSNARFAVAQAAVPGSSLRLRARLLRLQTAGSLTGAVAVVELSATAPGAGVQLEQTRSLTAGNYAIAVDHLPASTGEFPGSDATAAGRYTISLQALAEPDPQEQTSRNDTSATATILPLGATGLEGAIGTQTDHDWYRIEVPAASTSKLVEIKLDPLTADTQVELNLTVAEPIATPTKACDFSCGPDLLCVDQPLSDGGTTSLCAFEMHAQHHFVHAEATPESVRIPHLGAARAIYAVVGDQGDARFSALHYRVTARIIDDPDTNELLVRNDTIDAGTILDASVAPDKTVTYTATGAIAHWDYIDGRGRLDTPHDVDWFAMTLPPRELGPPDGGLCSLPDGGIQDAGCPDVPQPRGDYGIALKWSGPADDAYRIGIAGTVVVPDGGGLACRFTINDNPTQLPGLRLDGGVFSYGDQPTDLCFCLAAKNAEGDKLWFRVDAYNRSLAPAVNRYSEQPYSVTLSLSPGKLQNACDGGCVPSTSPGACAAQ